MAYKEFESEKIKNLVNQSIRLFNQRMLLEHRLRRFEDCPGITDEQLAEEDDLRIDRNFLNERIVDLWTSTLRPRNEGSKI
jgi:hypothetical protein